METYKTYQAKSTFMLRHGRMAYEGETLREPGDMTSQEAANLVAMGRIEPMSKAFPPSRKTLTTQSGGAGLVGGQTTTKTVSAAPSGGGHKGKAD
jgi:hypothetical protein